MSKVVSYSELQANNTKQNLWVAIHGKVYNVTKFIDEHPGGEEVIISEGGKDATEAFEDVGHSDEARGLLPDLLVGELDEASVSIQSNPPEQENSSQKDDNVLLETELQPSGTSAPLFDYDDVPPSPTSDEDPLEPVAQPQDSSQIHQHSPPVPPLTSAIEMPQGDPQPSADNAVSSDGAQRRTFKFGDWFRRRLKRIMPDRIPLEDSSHIQMSHQVPSDAFSPNRVPGQLLSEDPSRNRIPDQIPSDPPQTSAPQARAPPSNNQSSTLAPGQRIPRAVQWIDDEEDEARPSFWISMPSWICCGRTGQYTGETS